MPTKTKRERQAVDRAAPKCGCGNVLGLAAQAEGRTECPRCVYRRENNPDNIRAQYNAALNFALDKIDDHFDKFEFLRMWREGDWDGLAEHFPEFKRPTTE